MVTKLAFDQINGNFISVKDYGADPTGALDSSSAIANAITALGSEGGTVFFPPGTYLGSVVLGVNNVKLSGYGATIKSNSSTTELIKLQVSGGIIVRAYVEGFILDGQTDSTKGLSLIRGVDCVLRDLKIIDCVLDGIEITGDGVGASTHIDVYSCRINGAAGATGSGIKIGGGGVNAACRLFANYVTAYPTLLNDTGVNTVDIGGIYETATDAVTSAGGGGVYVGNWMESGSITNHYKISDSRTTVLSPHDTTLANFVQGAAGQYPARNNRILTVGGSLLGPTKLVDSGISWSTASASITDDIPKNLRGTVQISGASTSATVTFTTVEPDASYYVVATAVKQTNSPATGSSNVVKIDKTTTGFDIHCEVAPGGAGIVDFDWIIMR